MARSHGPKFNPPLWVTNAGEGVLYGILALWVATALFATTFLLPHGEGHTGNGNVTFLTDVGIALMAALVGGLVARLLRQPVLVGYLLAGIVVGPNTPGFIADDSSVRIVSDLGITLLMFAVGVQFSRKELLAVQRTALIAGSVHILGTCLIGTLAGIALGWGAYAGLFMGCALALSSTTVMMRILEERGEMGSAHGNVMLGIAIVQDLSLVLMFSILPALALVQGNGAEALSGVLIAVLRSAVFLAVTLYLALRAVPAMLDRVARTGTPELFLLTIVCLCLMAAVVADWMGLGLALGAFLAGVVVSESPYTHEVFSLVRPLRDVFASLFFVSVGMLLDPRFVITHAGAILLVVFIIIVGKAVLSFVPIRLLGWHGRTAVLASLGLAQIGEFSFLLATLGATRKLIPAEVSSVVLASALITLLLSPFLYGQADRFYRWLNRVPYLSALLNREVAESPTVVHGSETPPRVLVLGIGRTGRYVSDALRSQAIPQIAVDYNASTISLLQDRGVPVIYGDAASPFLLEQLSPQNAELAIVSLPETTTTEMVVRHLKRLAPKLVVVARAHRAEDIPLIRDAGADAVIHGEFEAGAEMIRQTLDRLGVADRDVETYIEDVRTSRYSRDAAPSG